ncbi:DUF5305 family protein [Actinoplanes sp. NPDC023936]|uniref:DUF5305 family protein n=1 Tax=Actinoplanes sp. NPDC023936 TaxID=3154910 RepID=UPI0033D2D615
MAAILVMAAIGAWAVSTHRLSYVITHGVSMNPTYYADDLVFLIKFDSYEVGQIAAYHGFGGIETLHRIIGGDALTGYVLQGDNNPAVDAIEPTANELIGRAVLHVPNGGFWLKPLLSPTALGMFGFLIVGARAAAVRSRRDIPRGRQKKRTKSMSGQGGSWAVTMTVAKAVRRLHPVIRALAVLSVVLAACALVSGVLGWMKPATQTTDSSVRAGESMTFSYSADVPRSAAYDGTTAYSPDPIYRNLAKFVVLRMQYLGRPGTVEVSARLSSQTGWHSTVRLAQPKEFSAQRFTGTVSLDLDGLDDRAQRASEAIGTNVGAITVAVTARVSHADGSSFEPSVSFGLTNIQLALLGGAESLVVERSAATSGGGTFPRQISLFGKDLFTAGQARSWAVRSLLVALAGIAVVALLAFRRVPLKNREQIQRRYPHLLVPVEPMASPPGKPVVIVDSFPALVKLAEKYGQMILTWTRPDGADDFVVRDDGVTYRYRIVPANVTPEPEPGPRPASHRRPSARKATGVAKVAAPPAPTPPQTEEQPVPEKEPVTEEQPVAEKEPAPEPAPEPATAQEKTEEKTAEGKTATEEPKPTQEASAPEPPKPPAKRARRPRKKAEPAAAKPEPTPTEADDKPPLQRPIRLKPEAERKAMETLGELNKSVGGASNPEGSEPEAPHEPIYDFLPKHSDQAPTQPGQTRKDPDQANQADGATGR